MIKEGLILYFKPFYFKNGNRPKPKYFIVLKAIDSDLILASLPTRKDAVPSKNDIDYGCIDLPEVNFNCFKISPSQAVTICGKYFDFPTFIYGHNLDEYSIEMLDEIYPNMGIDYEIWGEMNLNLFESMIECFKNSRTIKRKYKRLLNKSNI